MFYLFFLIAMALIFGVYFLCKYKFFANNEKFDLIMTKILKVLVVIYCSLVLVGILLPDSFARCLEQNEIAITPTEASFALVRWFSALSFVILPIAVFYKNKTIKNIANTFCLIMTVVSICMYPMYMQYATSSLGRGLNSIGSLSEGFKAFLLNNTFRSFCYGIKWLLELTIVVSLIFQEKQFFNVSSSKDLIKYFVVLPLLLIVAMPIYVPQHIFGWSNIIFSAWSFSHILWIIITIGQIPLIYYVFRNRDNETKMVVCMTLALSLLYQFNQMFGAISITIKKLPFQLCNIGSYLIILSLITKSRKLFNFTVIVNVVGIMFALFVPDLQGKGLFYLYNMHFIYEHTNVLVAPILALLFKIFPRLDKKALKDCLIGFTIYFVVVLALGSTFNMIAKVTGNNFYSANYLFMFDAEVATGFVAFLGKLFVPILNIGAFTFYPFIQFLVYLVFILLCVGLYFVIRLCYKIKDSISQKRAEQTVAN